MTKLNALSNTHANPNKNKHNPMVINIFIISDNPLVIFHRYRRYILFIHTWPGDDKNHSTQLRKKSSIFRTSLCNETITCSQSYWIHQYSYMLRREYRVVRSRYSRLLFTSEDRLCANSRVQEQSTNMTSQCQCLAFAWRLRSVVMTSQSLVKKDCP